MRIDIYKTPEDLGLAEANRIKEIIKSKEHPLLCVPAGQSYVCVFNHLIDMNKKGLVDFSDVKFVGLDEWYEYTDYQGTARWILDTTFFKSINVNDKNMRFFDATAKDPEEECCKIEKYIIDNGGIDYLGLGVGMNGHVALNEPGVDLNLGAHVNTIAQKTKDVSEHYFEKGMPVIRKGFTLGFKNIFEAREIVVVLNGERKAPIFEKFMKTSITNDYPVTNMKSSEKVRFAVDYTAAANVYKI